MQKSLFMTKVLIATISWTLCLAPVAQETSSAQPPGDPNYCYSDSASSSKKASCESSGLELNCHLNVCAKKEDNKIYNKEYSDCQARPDGERQVCQEDLKKVGQEIAENQKNMDSSTDAGSSTMSMATAAIATVGLGCAMFTGACPSDFGMMLAGAIGIAITFMTMQSGQFKKQLDEAKKQLKANDQSDVKNWSTQTQIATLTQQIAAMDMIIKAAREKAKKHQTVALLAGAIGTAALVCSVATITGCPAANPCTYFAAGAGFVVMAMELMAAKESNEVADKWEENKKVAEKLKKKIESLYNIDNPNSANQSGMGLAGNIGNSSGQSINLGAGTSENDLAGASLDETDKQCVDSSNNPSSCPCAGGSCQKITFQIPTTGIGAQVASKIDFKEIQTGANEAFNGDSRRLEALATPQNFATIQGIKEKLLKHVLDKDLIKGKDRELAQALLNPSANPKVISNYIANNSSPLRSAALAHRFGLSNYKPDNAIAALGEASKVPTYEDTSFKESMKNIQDAIELNTKKAPEFANNSNTQTSNLENNSGLILGSEINAEKQMNIFKIISNRYNILRVKKRIGN